MSTSMLPVPLLLIIAALALQAPVEVVWIVRPWDLRGGRWRDRFRVARVVLAYDLWLSLRGIGGRRRKNLRAELLANLWDATLRVGSQQATTALGSTRVLAAQSSGTPGDPQWAIGATAGLSAVLSVVLVQAVALTAWGDAAIAADRPRVEGSITLLPGMRATYEQLPGGGFVLGTDLGPLALVAGLAVFVVAARPWRAAGLLRPWRRRQRSG